MLRKGGRLGSRKHFSRIGYFLRVIGRPYPLHDLDIIIREHSGEIIAFLHSDPVLAGDGPPHLHTHLEDPPGQLFRSFQVSGNPTIIKDERMQISIAGVKHIGYPET